MAERAASADLIRRLKRIEGQVRGIQRMIEQDRACGDTLAQISAVTAALRSVSLLLAEQYALECLETDTGKPKRPSAKSREAVATLLEALMRAPR